MKKEYTPPIVVFFTKNQRGAKLVLGVYFGVLGLSVIVPVFNYLFR